MTTPFSESEVIRRTARRMGTNDTRIREFLDAYATEYIAHARETDPELIRTGIVAPMAEPEAPAKPAGKARTPRKSRAKATTPAKGSDAAQGKSEGTGSALIDSLIQREAESSVALDRDETHVVG